jgi:Do/DeqQ family serine protease
MNSIAPHRSCAAALVAGAALMFTTAAASAALPALQSGDGKPTLAPLLERVTPAVVNIAVQSKAAMGQNPLMLDPFFRRFFDLPEQAPVQPRQSAGSGVIVDAEKGYVLTNHHVIDNADEITVTLKDRRSFEAKLIGSDAGTDIALLEIEPDGLTALDLGDSDTLAVGDFVIAIGNPFGLGQTVTSGIVSALGRSGLNIEGYEDFIQTDASINPGNSGGALVDLVGKLIGINTAIIGPAGGNVGIGFAVPANMVHSVMDQLVRYGEVRRGRLGIGIQDVTPDLAEAMNLGTSRGAVVNQVEPDSPAEKAGLEAGDVVVEVDGRPVRNASDLRNRVGLMRVGEDVDVTVLRDGKRKTLRARIGKAEATQVAGGESSAALRGAIFGNVEKGHPLYGEAEGAVVTTVDPGSPAARNGLRPGDVIMAVNRQRVRSAEELKRALEAAGRVLALNVIRGGAQLFVVIQ